MLEVKFKREDIEKALNDEVVILKCPIGMGDWRFVAIGEEAIGSVPIPWDNVYVTHCSIKGSRSHESIITLLDNNNVPYEITEY